MPKSPPDGTPRVTPYLLYEDLGRAIDWLSRSFGLVERDGARVPDEDGAPRHTEMEIGGDGLVMIGQPGADFRSPNRDGGFAITLYVYVDDVDAHCEAARAAGAALLAEPADMPYGDRRYEAEDVEGHHWFFATLVRDVDPAGWQGGGD